MTFKLRIVQDCQQVLSQEAPTIAPIKIPGVPSKQPSPPTNGYNNTNVPAPWHYHHKLLYHIFPHQITGVRQQQLTFLPSYFPRLPLRSRRQECVGVSALSAPLVPLSTTPTIYYICLVPTTSIYVYPSHPQVCPMTLP